MAGDDRGHGEVRTLQEVRAAEDAEVRSRGANEPRTSRPPYCRRPQDEAPRTVGRGQSIIIARMADG